MKSDVQVKTDVLAELEWDPEIDHEKIGITVTDGAVTLAGSVPTYRQKWAARNAAKRVAGVHALVDNIEVQLDSQRRMTDEGLAERIAHVLAWNVSIPDGNIRAEVKKGVVTLTGELDWQYQRTNILRNIEHVSGVQNVVDLMSIRPRASASDVRERIKEALRRHAEVEASKIKVTASDGAVTLEGTVESLDEMDRVEQAAWASPGVAKVVDNLRIA